MAVDADTAVLVCVSVPCIVLILPEAAAKDSCLVRFHHPYADAAQLRVAAAHNHRRALGQPGLRLTLGGYGPCGGAAFTYLGENIGAQPAALGNGRIPVPLFKAEQAGGGAVAGFHGQDPGHLIDEPVIKHAHIGQLFVDLGHLVPDP